MIKFNLIGSVREREIRLSSKFLLVFLSSAIAVMVAQPGWTQEREAGERSKSVGANQPSPLQLSTASYLILKRLS